MYSDVHCDMLAGQEMPLGKRLWQFKLSVCLEDETPVKLILRDCGEVLKGAFDF